MSGDEKFYQVIVIGAGHAGVEAACASARVGAKTLLITKKPDNLGEMSCNPAIGGVAKGTIVREIDALDGIMGKAIDMAGIHFRILNSSKGPAVHSPRAQADRTLYKKAINQLLKNYPNLEIIFDSVEDLAIVEKKIVGVTLSNKKKIESNTVILTTGTFLGGVIHMGHESKPAGRFGEDPCNKLSKTLKDVGFRLGRLKTGTPPRIDAKTINFNILEKQSGDEIPRPFSYLNKEITTKQINCYITYTNQETHKIIEDNLLASAMYGGSISGKGPRYCPSIEDKIHRFKDKERHQIFLEPEGLESNLIYPNGISNSLPIEIQEKFVKSIKGLENCKIVQPGYAIEYDFVDPRELLPTLETKKIRNLFFAGQINGTTGYEEAGGQGLVAGTNAAIKSLGHNQEFTLSRSESYIGVMIDDLTTLGTSEPYRMLTSRAEYRLNLRADNADLRLTEKGIKFNLISNERELTFRNRKSRIDHAINKLKELSISPTRAQKFNLNIRQDGVVRNACELLAFKDVSFKDIKEIWPEEISQIDNDTKEQISIICLYKTYLKRQQQDIDAFKSGENMKIPLDIDYNKIESLSIEVKEKLNEFRPSNISGALKIQGVTPSSIMAIMVYIRKNYK